MDFGRITDFLSGNSQDFPNFWKTIHPNPMRFRLYSAFAFLLFLIFSCEKKSQSNAQFIILPSPVSFEIKGSSGLKGDEVELVFQEAKSHFTSRQSLADFQNELISFVLVPEFDANFEGYVLEISDRKVEIESSTDAGLWYGLMTLGQLLEDAKDQNAPLPICTISDEPALAYRAVHLDVKHHLEKKEYYFELMDRFAAQKINAVIVEIEDKLQYELQPKVGSEDAFSIEDWKEISEYALARNIRISPLVQGLGHASFILKHKEYEPLRDDPESDWAFNPLNEETYQVQFDLYEDALKAFPYANYLHVGGDEVHTTGRNSGKSPLELQLIWLNRVSDYAAQKGLTPIFWDDMPLKNAGVYRSIYDRELTASQVDSIWSVNEPNLNKYIDMFPKNCVYMRWNYDMPESPGNNRAIKWFTDNDFNVMGATAGQTRWNLMPQDQSNTNNIRDFALISIRNKADGLLLTLWDDDSPHFELYQRGISIFAEYTWAGEKRSRNELHQAYRQRAFGPALASDEHEFINALEGPVADWKNMLLDKKRDRNRLRKLKNPIEEALISLPNPDSAGVWTTRYQEKIELAKANLVRVDSILQRIQVSKKRAVRNFYTLDVYEQVAHAVQFSNRAILTLAELDEPSGEKRAQAQAKLAGMEAEWASIQSKVEEVYGKTRQLNKPADYLLDQDHHVHLANQALNFSDWQFYVEGLFLEKVKREVR
ncbi:Glycosyl hydrolase family 20, domain 2 [Algoriphagus boritolerans DSM 17298 = JCM 18970]|uniref:beta-N-acetylhexosaminidase n=2 Tax=Algoriphagus TaxID=246875 RepID=A0A1H5ZX13_9BACT|nr:Glycosyl hydrolase family 20, domain 2 [Algoriphagus boritolerans DSM 17298 = JCM 18970]